MAKKKDKFELEAPFNAVHGKLCRDAKIIFAKREDTMRNFTTIRHRHTKKWSTAVEGARQNFSQAAAYAKSVLLSTNLRTVAEAQFKKNKMDCGTLRGWLIKDFYSTKPYGGTIKEEI